MKILIADDHALFRDGLRMQLENIETETSFIETENFEKTIDVASKDSSIDLILLDLSMPGGSWEIELKKLLEQTDHAKIVILSATENHDSINHALKIGASGYIPKRSTSKLFINALKLILDGGIYLPPSVLCQTNKESKRNNSQELSNGKHLTVRQKEVLEELCYGHSNKQIAFTMSVSEATVKLHINALLRKLGANNRTQAVVIAHKKGLIQNKETMN